MNVLRCVIIRGGTSRGVYIHENELPPPGKLRDRVILDIFGSPDSRQIDGLGGADILTSKVCIIGPSKREDADIDYTFGQVMINRPLVDYSINCGNLSSGVGPFAIDEGIVKPVEPVTTVRIYNTNTKKILIAEVPVKDGKAELIRGYGAEVLGFVRDRRRALEESPAGPFATFVSAPEDYINHVTGETIQGTDVDLRAVIWAAAAVHKAYAVTGAICTSAAALFRTARRIMEGYAYLKPWSLQEDLPQMRRR